MWINYFAVSSIKIAATIIKTDVHPKKDFPWVNKVLNMISHTKKTKKCIWSSLSFVKFAHYCFFRPWFSTKKLLFNPMAMAKPPCMQCMDVLRTMIIAQEILSQVFKNNNCL